MKVAEYKKVDEQIITNTIIVDDYNEKGEVIGDHEEAITKIVPIMGMVYREETEEERLAREETEANATKLMPSKEEHLMERIAELEAQVDALKNYMGVNAIDKGNGVYEVAKPTEEETPAGDYLNPIYYVMGMSVDEGNFYYTDEWGKVLPREAIDTGTPLSFNDKRYFDWIEIY